METSKIKSAIKTVERHDSKFRLILTCGYVTELSFLEAKEFEPRPGAKVEAELLYFVPVKLVIAGKVVINRSKTDLFYIFNQLLTELKTQIQVEEIECGRMEFVERKSNLMAIFQHRTLLLQSFIGEKYTQSEWMDELKVMELAQKIYQRRKNDHRLEPMTFFNRKQICKAFPEAAGMNNAETGYALQLYNTMLEDKKNGIALEDFDQIKNKISYSRILRTETLKGDIPSVAEILSYHQSLLYGK